MRCDRRVVGGSVFASLLVTVAGLTACNSTWLLQQLSGITGVTGCMTCHSDIERAHANVSHAQLTCVDCHGGNPLALTKEEAHVQPTLPPINDVTTPPLDYDLPYQQFINPSNLRVVENTCGQCHPDDVKAVLKSMMATAAGHYAGGLYENNVQDTKTPIYGTFAVTDDDGDVPTDRGAVASLEDLIRYDPGGDPQDFATHFAQVPAQVCARCHLWSRGKGYRGAEGADGTYRADGCAACHMIYSNDGLSASADANIDHSEPGHPLRHELTSRIPSEQCIHCHHRGARIGLSFTGRAQMPPRLPSGPGVPGTTDVKFNGNYHYADKDTNPPDVHYVAGLHCIDCHTKAGVMGDGNIYGHMDQATKIECRVCHGTPQHKGTLVDNDGLALRNVRIENGTYILTSKVTGQEHVIPQLMDILDPDSPLYDRRAACYMNGNHIRENGGLECYACHTGWVSNCFGCHFERDERQMGTNLVTRELEIGKTRTANKIFETFRPFMFGLNSEGRVAPYIVGCQPIADVTAPDGSKILNFKMPVTSNGLSGLSLNPVQPHTVRGAGEVRTCVECHRAPPSLGLGSGNYAIARNYAFVAADDGVHVYDRNSDPAAPSEVAVLDAPDAVAMASLPDVVEGTASYLYAATGAGGVRIFDLTGGLNTTPAATIDSVHAIDVARTARYLYVVDSGTGVRIYDCDNPTAPALTATVAIAEARRVVPWGIHLLVAAGSDGLVVVNIADRSRPEIVGGFGGIFAADVQPYAHYQAGPAFAVRAYVADPNAGVHVLDLLPEVATPRLVTTLEMPDGAWGLDTYTRYVPADDTTPSREHDYLYVAGGASGLYVFDITRPDAIDEVTAVNDLGGKVVDVDVASQLAPPGVDDYAVLANETLGMQLVDVTDPLAPLPLVTRAATGAKRAFVEVQQMDRFLDEEGNVLKENSHPFTRYFTRDEIVRILSVSIEGCWP